MTLVGSFVRRYFEPLMLSAQVLIDLVVVLLACYVGYEIREYIVWGHSTRLVDYRQLFLLTAAVCLVCFHGFRMYSPLKSLLNVEEFKAITKSTAVAFLVVTSLITFLRSTTLKPRGAYEGIVKLHEALAVDIDPNVYSRMTLVIVFGCILALMTISRFFSFKIIQMLHRRGIGNRNVLIVGLHETAQRLQKKFVLVPTLGLNLIGFVGDRKDRVGATIDRVPILGTTDELELLIKVHKISEVFLAMPEEPEERVMEIVEKLELMGVIYRIVPRFYHFMSHKVRIDNLDSIPLVSRPDRSPAWVTVFGKRALDILLSLIIVLVGLPFFLLAGLLIRRESPGPVLFRQTRVGKNGKPFSMVKFRTMHAHMSGDAPAPRDESDPRITRVGRWLRRYSLDELPQVLNVLRGEMSIVGPRPEMPFIVQSYGPLQRERLRAKPGLTGLWQISYARGEAIHENIDYDIYYVEHQSVLLDLVIIALTAFAVVKGTGAY